MSNSASFYTSAPLKVPVTDAWGYLNTATPSIVDHTNVSTISRLGTGRYGVTFSNYSPFFSGAYVVLATPEYGDDASYGPVNCRIANPVVNGGTGSGRSAGFEFNTFSYNSNRPTIANTGVTVAFAAFSLSRDGGAYSARLGNYIPWSETFTNWTNGSVIAEADESIVTPYGTGTAFSLVRGKNNTNITNVISVSDTSNSEGTTNVNKHYTASVFLRAGNTGGVRVLLRDSSGVGGYEVRANLYGKTGNGALGISFGAIYFSQDLSTSPTSISEGISTLTDIGNDWRRLDMTLKYISQPASSGKMSLLIVPSPAPSGKSGDFIYAWGAQITEGRVPIPYIRTDGTAPVYGDDSPRVSIVPGSSAFGVTGATFNSQLTSLDSRRSATAYGTIVIPNRRGLGLTAPAYLENCFNVRGVSSASNLSVFDVTFTRPLSNNRYCVILSGEYESNQDSATTVSVQTTNEFSDLLVRAGQNNRFKTNGGFRIESLKQATDYSWNLAPASLSDPNGRTERIHFMVFGGGTYGQP